MKSVSKNFIWSSTWGSRALQNAELFRLDQDTGAVDAYRIDIPYANPYDVEIDAADKVWIATDNHLLKFDPVTKRFARYPVTVRTDIAGALQLGLALFPDEGAKRMVLLVVCVAARSHLVTGRQVFSRSHGIAKPDRKSV